MNRIMALCVRWAILVLMICLSSTGSGYGQEKEDDQKKDSTDSSENEQEEKNESKAKPGSGLRETIVTASRREMRLFDAPFSAQVFDLREIQIVKQSRTMPELFLEEPTVLVQKTSNGQGSPYIRGYTGFRTLLLIDGIRLNNSVMRDGPNQYWNTVDLFTVEQLELVKGPSSVLYGSDAIGGTVNVLTQRRQEYEDGTHWNARSVSRYTSADDSFVQRLEGSMNHNDKLGIFAGITFKDFNDVSGGRGVRRQPKTGYTELDGDIKLDFFLHPDHRITLAYQKVDQDDAWRTHKTIWANGWRGTSVGKDIKRVLDQDRELLYLQYHGKDLASWLQAASASISLHRQSEERDRIRDASKSFRREVQGFDVETLGFSVQLESDSPFGYLTYGAEYYQDEVDSFKKTFNSDGSFRSVEIQGPVGDNASYGILGIYLQDEFSLFDDKLDLTFGARYTRADAEADKVEDPDTGNQISISDDWDQFTGSARFLYHVNEQVNIFGGVSQGFRTPNLSDLSRLDTARSNEIQTPSPNLDPENFTSFELGTKIDWKGRWGGQASYFYTDVKDQIIRTPTGNIIDGDQEVQAKNVGDGYTQGFEMRGFYSLTEQWQMFGAFGWLEGKVETFPTSAAIKREEWIDRMMPTNGIAGVRWHSKAGSEKKWWMEGNTRIVAGQDKLSTRDQSDTSRFALPGGTPGYTIYNLRGGVQWNEHLNLSLGVENITDKGYRIHGSGQNEPGTNIVVTLELKF